MMNLRENEMAKANMATAERALNGWTKDHIQHILMTSDKALERGLLQIYSRQTADEQRSKETKEDNGVGFSGQDGEFLSDVASRVLKGQRLTENQIRIVRPKMLKYWRQLLEVAATSAKGPNFPKPAPQPKRTRTRRLF